MDARRLGNDVYFKFLLTKMGEQGRPISDPMTGAATHARAQRRRQGWGRAGAGLYRAGTGLVPACTGGLPPAQRQRGEAA